MIPRTMTIWFVAAIPVLIMFFALAMERLEHRLRYLAAKENLAVQENEVEERRVVPLACRHPEGTCQRPDADELCPHLNAEQHENEQPTSKQR